MKKIVSIFLSALMLVLCTLPASAISISEGNSALNEQMLDGQHDSQDYVYFSPVKGKSDSTKYPLLVWLHGAMSGKVKREQLENYKFSNWASDEYQSRFKNAGGCFLLAPRSTGLVSSWDAAQCSTLKATIDAFISENKDHIDTNRIYIAGYSTGGVMVWDMLSAYPDFFAAAMPLASITQPTAVTVNKLADVSVWIMSSDNDPYAGATSTLAKNTYNSLAEITNRKEGVRITTFSKAVFASGNSKNGHYIWEAVTFDMHMNDGKTPYLYTTTKDAAGNTITFDESTEGVITWLSAQSRPTGTDDSGTDNLNFFQRLINAIKRLIAKIKALLS